MKVNIVPCEAFARTVAQHVLQQVQSKPDSILCVATGSTTESVFTEIVRQKNETGIDFSKVFLFNVDNYLDFPEDEPASINQRLLRGFYLPLGLTEKQYYIPTTTKDRVFEEIERFEALIEEKNGIDLLILNVGENGHIAFNEPGTGFESSIHVVDISQSVIDSKKGLFGGEDRVPRRGITMGIKTLMHAKRIVMVANGSNKSAIMKAAIWGPVTTDVPASVVQLHPFSEIVLDESACFCG